MKVSINFEIENLEELEKINSAVKEVIPEYSVKMDISSEELNEEEERKS